MRANLESTPRKQAARSLEAFAYWDCRLTRQELLLLLLAFALTMTLHLSPVLDSGLAKPLLFALALLCFFRPFTGFFFIGASAILPTASAAVYEAARQAAEAGDVTGAAAAVDSAAKYGFIAWAIVTALRFRRFSLSGIQTLWPLVLLLLWQLMTSGRGSVINGDCLKDVLYCVMACQLANEAKGQYLKCLLGLCLGCLMVIIGFWAQAAGLPVTLATWGGERGGFERMGSVVADSVMLWPPLLTGIAGLLGLTVCLESRLNPVSAPKWIGQLTVVLFVACVPPMAATMAHGALAGFALVLMAFFTTLWLTNSGGRLPAIRSGRILPLFFVATTVVAGVIITDSFQVKSKLEALLQYYEQASQEQGAAASRTGVWTAAIDTIRRYPLMGVDFNGGTETMPAEYVGKSFYLSHNVFLDYGRHSGIPGMLLFAWFFFWPLIQACKRGSYLPYMPFLLAHFAFFVFFMSLSFVTYKAFWGFWILMAMAATRGPGLTATKFRGSYRYRKRRDVAVPSPVTDVASRSKYGGLP
jgi:O-antigen ligase